MMTRLVLFDLDNTLVDRQAAFRSWASSFASRRGLAAEAADWLCEADQDGLATRRRLFEGARSRLGLSDSADELIAQYRLEYFAHFEPNRATLGAIERLRVDGWRVGIVTNGPVTQLDKIHRSRLDQLIDGYCVSDDLGIEKPDPRIFSETVRRCTKGMSRVDQGWMVGDSPSADIAGGQGAGLRTVWIHRDRQWTETEFSPDVIAADVGEAVERIISST